MRLYRQLVNHDDDNTVLFVIPDEEGNYIYRTFHAIQENDLTAQKNIRAKTLTAAVEKLQEHTKGKEYELYINLYPYQNRMRGLSLKEMKLIQQGLEQLNQEDAKSLSNEIKALVNAMEGVGRIK